MKWNEVQDNWKTFEHQFKTKWTKLTEADLKAVAGKREALITRLQTYYPTEKPKLEKELDEFIKTLKAKV